MKFLFIGRGDLIRINASTDPQNMLLLTFDDNISGCQCLGTIGAALDEMVSAVSPVFSHFDFNNTRVVSVTLENITPVNNWA